VDSRILFLPRYRKYSWWIPGYYFYLDIGDIVGGFQDTIDTNRYRRYSWWIPGYYFYLDIGDIVGGFQDTIST